MISSNEKDILFIEPDADNSPTVIATSDELTRRIDYILTFSKPQTVHFRGFHRTRCGKISASYNLDLPDGYVTNTLADYYVKHYRLHIPIEEVEKINDLYIFIMSSLKYPLIYSKEDINTLRRIKNTKEDLLLNDRIRFNEIVDSPMRPTGEILLFMKELIDRN